jgi:hypothetical protein
MMKLIKRPLSLCMIAVVFLLLIISIKKVFSPDIGFHLHAGQWMLEHKEILKSNLFTYPLLDKLYVDLHWIYQICLYSIFSIYSYSGLTIFNSFVILTSVLILWYVIKKESPSREYLLPIFILLFALSQSFEIRPHVFSWVFLSLQLLLIKKVFNSNKLSLYLIFAIQVIWINFHSLAILGPIVFLIYFIGDYIETKKFNKQLGIIVFGSILSCLINPWFIDGLLFPLKQFGLIQNNNNLQNIYIGEFQSLFSAKNFKEDLLSYGGLFPFAPSFYMYLFNALALFSIPNIISKKKYTELLLLIAYSYIGILAVKNFGFQFFAIAPIIISNLPIPTFIRNKFNMQVGKKSSINLVTLNKFLQYYFITIGIISVLLIFSVINGGYYIASKQPFSYGLGADNNLLPIAPSQFIANNKLAGKCINFLGFGGQLSFELDKPVFADGRLELMGDFFNTYLKSFEPNMFPKVCDFYQANIAVFPYVKTGMYGNWWISILQNKQDWKLVYFDQLSVIYVKRNDYPKVPELTEERVIHNEFMHEYSEQEIFEILNKDTKQNYFLGFVNSLFFSQQNQNTSDQNKAIFCFTCGFNKAALNFSARAIEKSTVKSKIVYENLSQYFKEIGNFNLSKKMLQVAR